MSSETTAVSRLLSLVSILCFVLFVLSLQQDPEKDSNVLRAVKVSFQGWGPAMDAWFPVDGGMVAKPGTHLPVVSLCASVGGGGSRR